MKKIAIIYSGAKYSGGIERYLLNLFANYDKKEVELTLLSLGDWPLNEEIRKVKGEVRVFSGNRFRIRTIFDIANYLNADNYDLITAGGLVASSYARAASLISGLPCVITVHSVQSFDYPNSAQRYIYQLANLVSRWKTTKYIAVSEFIKKELVREGINPRKVKVIYNGVPEISVSKKTKGKRLVIGAIGRFHQIKGFHRLIDAIKMLDDQPIELKLWGDGEDREILENMIRVHQLENKVTFMGYTQNVEKALESVDIFVQPSRMEGFGLTVVEAMFAEKPIVVTPGGSLPEIIKDGDTGIVTKGFEPEAIAAGLKILIENEKFATDLASRARKEAINKFDINKFTDETISLYLEVLK